MYNVYKWIYKGVIFFSLLGMIDILQNNNCYFALICCISLILYMGYRLLKYISDINLWGEITSPLSIGYDNYDYLNYGYGNNDNNHFIVYGSKKSDDTIETISNCMKIREDKIEILETTTKTVDRPKLIIEANPMLMPIKPKEVVKQEDKPIINPNEFNKELIMLVNDEKITKEVSLIYDCIISSLKDCKLPSSMICTILQAFPYIDYCGNQVIIYINNRQLEGVVLSKIKRKIITIINEKLENKVQTVFKDMKYYSVFDYFVKNNAL